MAQSWGRVRSTACCATASISVRSSTRAGAYPGEHHGIIDAELFQQVQDRLEQNRVSRRLGEHAVSPSLLIGIVYDGLGRKMSPDHASKGERKFRYYASRRDTPEERQHPTWRVPAVDLEEIVVGSIANLLRDRSALLARVQMPLDSAQMQRLFDRAEQKGTELHTEDASVQRQLLWDLVTRVDVDKDRIIIRPKLDMPVDDTIELNNPEPLTVIARILRASKRTTIMVPASGNVETTRHDASLIVLIATAASAPKLVEASTDDPKKIAAALDYDMDYFARLVRIGYLAPDITSAILEGRRPRTLTRQHLARLSNLPISWKEQRQLLGFAIS